MNEIPTPRTDAESRSLHYLKANSGASTMSLWVTYEFASILERELAVSKARNTELEQKMSELANHVLVTDERHEHLLNCERLLGVAEKALTETRKRNET